MDRDKGLDLDCNSLLFFLLTGIVMHIYCRQTVEHQCRAIHIRASAEVPDTPGSECAWVMENTILITCTIMFTVEATSKSYHSSSTQTLWNSQRHVDRLEAEDRPFILIPSFVVKHENNRVLSHHDVDAEIHIQVQRDRNLVGGIRETTIHRGLHRDPTR